MNFHYCKLADDCNWCSVKHCPYEKLEDEMEEMEDMEIMDSILDDEEGGE